MEDRKIYKCKNCGYSFIPRIFPPFECPNCRGRRKHLKEMELKEIKNG